MSKGAPRFRAAHVRSTAVTSFFSLMIAFMFIIIPGIGRKALVASPAQAENGDWIYADHDFNGTRYSPLTQITPGNVKQLAKVCSYTIPEKVPSESAPIVSAGVMYVTSDHYTVAIDAVDCHEIWS